jgi:hypothetical protein
MVRGNCVYGWSMRTIQSPALTCTGVVRICGARSARGAGFRPSSTFGIASAVKSAVASCTSVAVRRRRFTRSAASAAWRCARGITNAYGACVVPFRVCRSAFAA